MAANKSLKNLINGKWQLGKDSFFGTLHGQSNHAVEFFTQTKVIIERWPKDWTRKF